MNKSESIKELATALSLAQSELQAAKFDAVNPFLKNSYASLGSIIETARPVLAKNGLSVSQLPIGLDGRIGLSTILMHSSGQWIESSLMLPVADEKGKSTAQVAGSIISYLRRYAFASVLGIYAEDDADGNKPVPGTIVTRTVKEADTTTAEPPKTYGMMTVEMAKTEVGSDGTAYGDLTKEQLIDKFNGIEKLLKAGKTNAGPLSPERIEELRRKRDAAHVLITSMT